MAHQQNWTFRSRTATAQTGITVTRPVLFIVAIGIAGLLGYRQIDRFWRPAAAVWVSAADLPAGKPVTTTDLRMIRTSPPSGALVNRADIEGRTLITPKAKGQPFYVSDLKPKPPPPSLAAAVPAGRLLATVHVSNMDVPVPELRAGDRLDVILATENGVRVAAHDAYVMGVLESRKPSSQGEGARIMGVDVSALSGRSTAPEGPSIVLALRPQDVFPMASAEASGRRMKIVLHGASEVRSGRLLSVAPAPASPVRSAARLATPQVASVELLIGARRETISFPSGRSDARP